MLGFTAARKRESGDTLIEVLFAVMIFSFIVVTALSLMNQGVAASQRALEITTVRQQMDGQAEVLRFLHESYVEAYQVGYVFNVTDPLTSPAEEYYKLIQFVQNGNSTPVTPFNGSAPCVVPAKASKDFILNPVTAQVITLNTKPGVFEKATAAAQLTYQTATTINHSQGIWVEAMRSPGVTGALAGYIDFHIRACWEVPGSDLPMNLGTIVRLYEPRG
ncbi:MAG: hypothetical protein JWO54_392 [Candidatus Saccharibacteria bacterium]|nr:hypothetical protein [Candidatus Saccharibacteria bacterium]MDB5180634.1 hypothetical protein [Candidatus Saccharibacteria bacterium]